MSDIFDPSIEEMRPRLLTLDTVRERLAATEPLTEVRFTAGDGVEFRIDEDWTAIADATAGEHPVGAYVRLPGQNSEIQLTKDALLEAGAKVGIPRKLQQRTPSHLLEPQLNWWFGGNGGWEERAFKGFSAPALGGDGVVLHAFGSGTVNPFSNLRLLDTLVAGLHRKYGADAEVLADYKFNHGLEDTQVRLIVPGESRNIDGPGTAAPNDLWSTGVQFRNSQLGLKPTQADGYVFRWRCTNGMIDTAVTSGKYSRRAGGSDEDAVYEWAAHAVDEILGGLEETLAGVQDTTSIRLNGDVNLVLDDLFRQHNVPVAEASQVVRNMAEEGGDLTMYTVLNAITAAANDASVTPYAADRLLRVGGHVSHAAARRCETCRRIQPE